MSVSIKYMTVWDIFVFFNLFPPFRKWVGLLGPICFFYGKQFLKLLPTTLLVCIFNINGLLIIYMYYDQL